MNSIRRAFWRWLEPAIASVRSHRQWLLLCCLFGAGANALLCHFVYQPGYDHDADLVATGVFWALMLAVPRQRGHVLIGNLGLLTALTLTTYITVRTGGINSPGMVWMTVLAVPALLVLGRRWALVWMAVVLLVSLALYLGVMQGWIGGEIDNSAATVIWALKDKIMVILSLMLVVTFYDRMHQRQMREVELRNTELETTQKALLQAQSHKDEFIASVGHELRTPMNAILGLNGVLLAELADEPEDVRIATHIRDSTRQLLRLVNDILDFSQLEAGRVNLLEKPVHLEPTLRRVLAPFEARAREKSLDFHLQLDPWLPMSLLLDGQRLEQVLANLLDNAIKFTPRGAISVNVRPAHGAIRFEVEDTGRGIASDRQQQVFKRFEHADIQTKRAYGGTGLGLAICERLVSLQGGQIGVHSTPGKGSTFWFELPLRPAVPGPDVPGRALRPQNRSTPIRFLLVDDNAVNLMVARLAIGKCWPDASISSAADGEQALRQLGQQAFDLVLMDMVMPVLDGLETTRRLRQHPRPEIAQLPVIGLTANTSGPDRERCLRAGMDEILAKPVDSQDLQDAVHKLLGSQTPAGPQEAPACR